MKPYICLIFIVIVACSEKHDSNDNTDQSNIQAPEGWQSHETEQFAIQYPDTFSLSKSHPKDMEFMISTRLTPDDDDFSENINLMIQDLDPSLQSLDDYLELSIEQITDAIGDKSLLESTRLKGTTSSHMIVFQGNYMFRELKWMQQYWIIDDKAFVLTFTAEKNKYDAYYPVASDIFKTFVIK